MSRLTTCPRCGNYCWGATDASCRPFCTPFCRLAHLEASIERSAPMEKSVSYLGLVIAPITVGGVSGPEVHSPGGDCPIAAFALPGWKANDPVDEAAGQKAVRAMEAVGRARVDGEITATEFGSVAAALELPGGKIIELALPLAEEVARRLEDDGEITRADQVAIAKAAMVAVVRALIP